MNVTRNTRFRQSKIHNPKSKMVRRSLLPVLALLLMGSPAYAQISISSVTPDTGWGVEVREIANRLGANEGDSFELTVTGSIPFPGAMTLAFSRAGQPELVQVVASWVSPTEVVAPGVNLTGLSAGVWDVKLTHAVLGTATLPGAFTVKRPPNLRRIGAWGGPVQVMEVREELIGGVPRQIGYVARGSGMVVLDVTDPANMVELASLDLHSRGVYDLALHGDYAIVGAGDTLVNVVDISDPADPRLVVNGLKSVNAVGPPTNIAISGNTAYFIFRPQIFTSGDLRILDITDPENLDPDVAGNFLDLPGFDDPMVSALTVAGGYLYLVIYGEAPNPDWWKLNVYDLSADPLAPTLVATTSLFILDPLFPTAIDVEGDLLAVTAADVHIDTPPQLTLVDISNPVAPFVNGVYVDDLFFPMGVTLADGLAYVADYDAGQLGLSLRVGIGLHVVDVTNPTLPTPLGTVITRGAVGGVTVAGTTAYMFDRAEGVVAVDAADPSNPTRVGNWHSPGIIMSMDSQGDTLVVSDVWNGLTMVDVSDPRSPTLAGVHQTVAFDANNGGSNTVVKVQDGYAYLAAGHNGLEIVDISNPANPFLAAAVPPLHSETYPALAVRDHVLVVAESFGGPHERVFDISDPTNPVAAGSFEGAAPAMRTFAISDDFLAVGWTIGGFGHVIYDVFDPYNPVAVEGWGDNTQNGCSANGPPNPWYTHIVVDGTRIYAIDAGQNASVQMAVYGELGVDPLISHKACFDIWQTFGMDVQDGIAYVSGKAFTYVNEGDHPQYGDWTLLAVDVASVRSGFERRDVIAVSDDPKSSGLEFVHADFPYVYGSGPKGSLSYANTGVVSFLVLAPGDADGDFDVDLHDYAAYQRCFAGPDVEPADPLCLVFDFDEDDDVDADDLQPFLLAWGQSGILWASSDPAEFTAYVTAQGLTQTGFEDFEEANLPPAAKADMNGPPLDSTTDNGIFRPGDIAEGLTIMHNDPGGEALTPNETGFVELDAFSAGWRDALSKGVASDDGSLDLVFDPLDAPRAVGLDLLLLNKNNFPEGVAFDNAQVMVFDTDGELLRRWVGLPGDPAGDFLGVWAAGGIGRINIYGHNIPGVLAGGQPAADNIQMWAAP